MMSVTAVLVVEEDIQADLMCMSVVFTPVSRKYYLKKHADKTGITFIFLVVN